jgi:hypothetical protein
MTRDFIEAIVTCPDYGRHETRYEGRNMRNDRPSPTRLRRLIGVIAARAAITTAAGLTLAGTASATHSLPPPDRATCVGHGISYFARIGESDDRQHEIQALAAAFGIPMGEVTASYARITGDATEGGLLGFGCPAP